MNKRIYLLAVFFAIMLAACEDTKVVFDPEPVIFVQSVSPISLTEFQENIVLVINYEDGDGDLGAPDPDAAVVYVKDSRLADTDTYHLSPRAPLDAALPIQGTFDLILPGNFILGNGNQEQFTYDIYIVDRSGNASNTVSTPTITVNR